MKRLVASICLLAGLAVITGCDRFTSVETRMARASTYLAQRQYQAALIDLHKILDKEPDNTTAQLLLVDVLAASGEIQAARSQLDRAIESGAPASETDSR